MNHVLSDGTGETSGFSLVEVIIVLLIIGIGAAMSVAGYQKTVESSKADTAVSLLLSVGTASRLYLINNGSHLSTSNKSLDKCDLNGPCRSGDGQPYDMDACNLFACKYLPPQDFSKFPYEFKINGGKNQTDQCGVGQIGYYVACAIRRPCPSSTASCVESNSMYAAWAYTIDLNGEVKAWGGAPQAQ